MKTAVLVFLLDGAAPSRVLLGLKKVRFGKGYITGIGGKIEAGESAIQAACRETQEEIGVIVTQPSLQPAGQITFCFPAKPSWEMDVTLFTTTQWQGTPTESDEIEPLWFALDAMPYEKMWDDSRFWLRDALIGKKPILTITYNDDNKTVAHIALTNICDHVDM